MLTEILSCIVVLVAWVWYKGRNPENSRFPKGPFAFPLIGTLPHLRKHPLKTLIEWKKEYGNFVGLSFGSFRAVLINDYQLIKEAFNAKEFSGRPAPPPVLLVAKGAKRGLVPSEGTVWEEQRRFCLRHLRDFGFGKRSMESLVHEYAEDVITSFLKENGKPIDTHRRFNIAVLGTFWSLIAGEKLEYGNLKFQDTLDNLNALLTSADAQTLGVLIPWTIKVAPEFVGWNKIKATVAKVHSFMQGHIDEHKRTFQEDNIRDLMDLYISRIKETTDPHSSFYKEEGELNMLVAILNLFVAGSETTNLTINWALLSLAMNKDVQRKLYDEIVRVVGTNRFPSLDDRTNMPYTEAVIMETFRISSITPFGIFHNTMEDVEFHGHFIPKDTMIIPNLYGLHHDPEIWGKDVEEFRPERFLDSEGNLTKDHPPIVPFSIGKRQCLGESLARIEFYTFLTTLCQRFEIDLAPETPELDFTLLQALFRALPSFQLVFTDRQTK